MCLRMSQRECTSLVPAKGREEAPPKSADAVVHAAEKDEEATSKKELRNTNRRIGTVPANLRIESLFPFSLRETLDDNAGCGELLVRMAFPIMAKQTKRKHR